MREITRVLDGLIVAAIILGICYVSFTELEYSRFDGHIVVTLGWWLIAGASMILIEVYEYF